jgi:hypothetical protein
LIPADIAMGRNGSSSPPPAREEGNERVSQDEIKGSKIPYPMRKRVRVVMVVVFN